MAAAVRQRVVRPAVEPDMASFAGFLLVFFLLSSGVVYDFIVRPKSTGTEVDRQTGVVRPVAFMQNRINGQYIVEGVSAGLMFALVLFGFLLLEWSAQPGSHKSLRYVMLGLGAALVSLGFNLATLFFKIKLPYYLM